MEWVRDLLQSGPSRWWGLAVLTCVAGAAWVTYTRARLPAGQPNIVRLEVAGRWDVARDLDISQSDAVRAISWDFAFIACYVVLLGGLALWVAPWFTADWLRMLAVAVAAAMVVAGLLDVVEDVAMLVGISHDYSSAWAWVWPTAAACALTKFLILAASAAYVAAGVVNKVVTALF